MTQKCSRGTRGYPQMEAADWEVSGAIADTTMAPWGMGSMESAEARLRRALELVPDHLEGLNLLAQVCAQTSRHKEAISLLECGIVAVGTRPADLVLFGSALAETYEARRDFRRAKAVYQRCLEATDVPEFHSGLGYCLGKLGDLRGAVRHAEVASKLAPERADYLSDWAWSLIELGRPAEALPLLERAVAMDPANELARGNLDHCRTLLQARALRPQKARGKLK
jgi:Flp pilus assembly protein TadD